jgi:4-amino-4-deoxy-L-arabinose transferase-like glycosyltransferase
MSETHDTEAAPEEREAPRRDPDARPPGRRAAGERDAGDADAGAEASEDVGREESEALHEPGGEPPDAGEGDDADDSEPPLLLRGNPLRLARGGGALAAGSLVAFLVMAIGKQYRFGVPIGALGVLAATFGLLDLLGSFDDPDERVASSTTLGTLARPLALLGGGLAALFAIVSAAVGGYLTIGASAMFAPAAFLGTIVGGYGVVEALGVFGLEADGTHRPLLRRHGFWLVVATTLLYLPMLGSHSLSDPWETHYGEVAREILARNDWISLWWAQDGWFWSKPVLDFWIQALAMATFGVRYHSNAMLSAVAEGREPWPEWAVRLPIFLLTLLAGYLLYKAVARAYGRRAGLLGALVLTTMPQWFMVSHQTMTDMPFVATMAATMALFLLGASEDPEREVDVYELDVFGLRLRLSAYHLVFGAVIAVALPQILYLLSRNFELELSPFRPRVHPDLFSSGSPGNCGLPGNEACRSVGPVAKALTPALQALVWGQALAIVLYVNWGERRAQRLYFLGAWFFAAVSTMAKGPAGFVLPALSALAYVAVTRRWRDLTRMEIASGFVLLAALALPWFVAMYARHGQPFTDRLIFHDMYKRALTHVHDTNEGDDVSFRFYVWQLGYAMFPWTGLAPAGLVAWLKRREGTSAKADSAIFFAMWFLFSFGLFSFMPTKFHHYILPAVPPAAMLVGVLLDELLPREGEGEGDDEPDAPFRRRFDRAILGAAAVAGAALVVLVGRDMAKNVEGMPSHIRLLHLFTYNYKRPWPTSLDFTAPLWGFTIAAGVVTALLVVASWRKVIVPALVGLGVLFTAWGLDVYFVKVSPHWGQRETTLAYYREAKTHPGPFIAYQMNWKGENFYSGNHVPAFVSTGKKFTDYIADERKRGNKTFYFVTEHGRTGSLSTELGPTKSFEKLTPPELDNKFLLVRAVFE